MRGLAHYRQLAALICGLAAMQAAVAALSAFAPLALASRGEGALGVGIAAAGYAAGFLLGALRAVKAVQAIGHIRAFATFAAVSAIASLGLFGSDSLLLWAALQLVQGFCVSTLLTAGESWIADIAPAERRGALLAFYMVVSKLGQIVGPVALAGVVPGAASGFMIVAGLFAASLVPVSMTRRGQPTLPESGQLDFRDLWRRAPGALVASFIAGAVNGAVLQLYALFAAERSDDAGLGAAAGFNAALAIGAVVAQWPAGWISDRMDRRTVIAGLAAIGSAASVALWLLGDIIAGPALLLLATVWGAGSLAFYGVAVAHAADRSAPGQTTTMMASILVVWAVGAIIGPAIAGGLMSSPLGSGGLFAYAAVGLACLVASMLVRKASSPATEAADKSPFAVAPATSPARGQLDPRADDDPQLDLFSPPPTRTPDPAQ